MQAKIELDTRIITNVKDLITTLNVPENKVHLMVAPSESKIDYISTHHFYDEYTPILWITYDDGSVDIKCSKGDKNV